MGAMGVRCMGENGISQFAVELLFLHCKKDFHRLLANHLFFLYLQWNSRARSRSSSCPR
jgi:hypothetical protein